MTRLTKVTRQDFGWIEKQTGFAILSSLPEAVTSKKGQIPDFRETPKDNLRLLAVASKMCEKAKRLFFIGVCLLTGMTLSAYEAIIFGDVHYDSDAVRDPSAKRPAYQEKEKARNLKRWAKDIPDLMDRGAAKVNPQTAFVLQLGDLVQGDCGNRKLHEKSVNTVLSMFLQRFPGTRFLAIPGNHDVRGKGAAAGYRAVMLPYLGRTLNREFSPKQPIQYALMQDKDLYVFLDCNDPDPDFLEKSLAAHPERRHLFVVTHFPVLPFSEKISDKTIFGKPITHPERWKKRIDLLAENNAIVLCAHIHTGTFIRWQNQTGSITQMTFFSIFPADNTFQLTDRDIKNPFPGFVHPGKRVMAVIHDILPGYREFKDIKPGAGFAILKPTDQGVALELYYTKAAAPTHTLKLK